MSYHSYSRVPCANGASGLDQLISRWYTGKRRNMPPGASSRERTAMRSIPERASEYAVCTGRGDASTISLAHGRSPSAISNPELRLPMMKTRFPW